MRVLIAIFIFFIGLLAQDLNTKYKYILDLYDKTNIRSNLSDIDSIRSPFFIPKSAQSKPSSTLKLEAIIENRAKIDSKWYELGQDCHELCIVEIRNSSVTVLYNNQQFNLKIIEEDRNVKIF